MSITYNNTSSPRKHIWTYAGGAYESGTNVHNCPCNTGSPYSPPSFLGNNYYCESSSTGYDDILWDGQQRNGLELLFDTTISKTFEKVWEPDHGPRLSRHSHHIKGTTCIHYTGDKSKVTCGLVKNQRCPLNT